MSIFKKSRDLRKVKNVRKRKFKRVLGNFGAEKGNL